MLLLQHAVTTTVVFSIVHRRTSSVNFRGARRFCPKNMYEKLTKARILHGPCPKKISEYPNFMIFAPPPQINKGVEKERSWERIVEGVRKGKGYKRRGGEGARPLGVVSILQGGMEGPAAERCFFPKTC